jgi:hypothetical protein
MPPATIANAYTHTSAPATTRAGMGCLEGACHGSAGRNDFAFAGTVYKESSATTPASGVTVRIFKPGEMQSIAEAVTDNAGNFIIRTPANFGAFPYETHVTICGPTPPNNIKPMFNQISAADANCSAGNTCHGMGGLQGAVNIMF